MAAKGQGSSDEIALLAIQAPVLTAQSDSELKPVGTTHATPTPCCVHLRKRNVGNSIP